MRSQTNTPGDSTLEISLRLLDIEQSRKFLGGIGTTKLYELVNSGHISPVHIGRRTFFVQRELERFVSKLAGDQS